MKRDGMILTQHHADMYVMLQMQRRLIAALQEALDLRDVRRLARSNDTC